MSNLDQRATLRTFHRLDVGNEPRPSLPERKPVVRVWLAAAPPQPLPRRLATVELARIAREHGITVEVEVGNAPPAAARTPRSAMRSRPAEAPASSDAPPDGTEATKDAGRRRDPPGPAMVPIRTCRRCRWSAPSTPRGTCRGCETGDRSR
jgi:hypothetical protein